MKPEPPSLPEPTEPAMPDASAALALISTPEHVLSLQRAIGNRAVLNFLDFRFEPYVNRVREEVFAEQSPEGTPLAEEDRLIIDDSATSTRQGQMRKSEFLAELRRRVAATAEEALSNTIWAPVGCPWIDQWFDYYEGQSATYVERAVRRYAPETQEASSAREYISIVCARIRRGLIASAAIGRESDPAVESSARTKSLARSRPSVARRLRSAIAALGDIIRKSPRRRDGRYRG